MYPYKDMHIRRGPFSTSNTKGMEAVSAIEKKGNGATKQSLPLHTRVLMPHAWANRVFAFVYLCAMLALLYHHFIHLLHSTSMVSIFLLLVDAVLAFMCLASQACRMCLVFIEHFQHYAEESEYPRLDVFICTADPYKEPPMSVVNTAVSVKAYDYPIEKLSVYVSDDGGSKLNLFAFMEAARLATHWLPYCRKNMVTERCPEAYFRSNHPLAWSLLWWAIRNPRTEPGSSSEQVNQFQRSFSNGTPCCRLQF